MMDLNSLTSTERIPLIGNLELTRNCPFRCVMCYNERKSKPELTTNEILNIITQLANAGCMYLHFTGGDPLFHEDFTAIYMHAVNSGIIPSVESELAILSDDILETLKKHPPLIFYVSVYAAEDEALKRFTNSNVKAQTVFDNVIRLINANIKVEVRTPVTNVNISQLGGISRFCKQHGIKHKQNTMIFWTQGGERKDHLRCTLEDVTNSNDGDDVYDKIYKTVLRDATQPIIKKSCDTGLKDFNISAYGEINFCITFWEPTYDLRNGSFMDAWDTWYPIFRRFKDNYCLGKNIFNSDGNCPWGVLYSDKSIDSTKSLTEHCRDKIEFLKKEGFDTCEIMEVLGLEPQYFNMIRNAEI